MREAQTLSTVPHGCTIDRAAVAQNGGSPHEAARKPFRVLLVAEPDDEYEVAGTVYRISKELFGTVHQGSSPMVKLATDIPPNGARIHLFGSEKRRLERLPSHDTQ